MLPLVFGLALFIGTHLLPTAPALRKSLVGRLGEAGYKGLFTILSLAGLVIIALGYAKAQALTGSKNPILWSPPIWTRHIAFALMIPALILFVAAYVPSNIRTAAKHPMLAGVKVWALAHLIANGDLAAVLLFGSLLAWAVFDRISVKRRGALGPLGAKRGGLGGDVIAVVAGLAIWGFMMVGGHYLLIGKPLISYNLFV